MRQESIKKILDTSLQLFGTKGYHSTSISEIAKKAGISKGLMYNYFESKEHLLREMVKDMMSHDEQFKDAFINDDPSVMLRNLITVFFEEIQKNKSQWKLITSLSLQIDEFDFIHKIALKKMEGYHILLSDLLKHIGFENPENEAKLLAALFDGIGMQYLILDNDYPLQEIQDYLLKKYCSQ